MSRFIADTLDAFRFPPADPDDDGSDALGLLDNAEEEPEKHCEDEPDAEMFAGGPCLPGQTAARTGCIPATKDAPASKTSPEGRTSAPGKSMPKQRLAPKEEARQANKIAKAKIAAAPVPSREEVVKARAEMEAARRGEARAGGESRGGSAASRRKQRENLFNEFGGAEKGYVVCPWTGIKMHWTDDPKLNPKGYPKFERGKIFVKHQGGGYQMANLIPESFAANRARNDAVMRKENQR